MDLAYSLKGKNILVTGGSRGIGAAIVRVAAELGARVAFTYSTKSELAEKVRASLPGEGHISLAMDVGSESSIDAGFSRVLEQFTKLDGLVNNAGITKDQLALRMKADDFDQVINTNLRGTFLLTKLAIKGMLKERQGSIVSLSSVVAAMGNPGQANYSASKAGIEAMMRSLAHEVGSRSLRLNCVAPGFIETDMTSELSEAVKKSLMDRIPLQRLGQPEDVARLVCFLLSPASTYITGQTFHVDGGLVMH